MVINFSQIRTGRFLSVVLFCAVAFAWNGYGQNTDVDRKAEVFKPFKIGEIGEMPRESWEQELTKLVDTSKDYPGSRVSLIVYAEVGTQRTSIDTIGGQYRDFLRKFYGDTAWISVTPGGYRRKLTTELWIESKDGASPVARPDEPFKPEKVCEIGEATNKEFDELQTAFWHQYWEQQPSSSQGYIINYGSDAEIARREKLITDRLTLRSYDRSRITLVRGGDKYPALTTFWFIPLGASNPIP